MSKTINRLAIATLSLIGLTVLAGIILMSSGVSANDSAISNVSVNVPVACTMTGTGMNSHNATIPNGTYQNNIGTTTMKAVCNDSEGFAIYANGYTGDTLGNNKLIGSSTASEIVTGTNTSGNTSNWAMKLAAGTGTYPLTLDNGFGSYSSVPASYTKVAHRDSGTDLGTSAEGTTLTSTYAAYISKTQLADSYIGQVIYTLVHPASEEPAQPVACEARSICYQPNSSSVVGEMGKQTRIEIDGSIVGDGITNNSTVTLWAPNFKRTGYGFAGWNTAYDYSGTNYGPNQTITTPSDIETNGLSLYAVWIKSAGSLQNWNGCSNMNIGDVTALTDNRDNDTYAVAKLVDGKCWIIENLRLNESAELSSINSHNPSLPITNIYDTTNPTTSNHLSTPVDPTVTAWCTSGSATCIDQSMLANNNTTLFTSNIARSYSSSSNVYSYGNYYNWYSSTAGHGKYGPSYDGGYTAPGDICPSRWHLPTSNVSGDFSVLDVAMGGTGADQSTVEASNRWRTYPNNFVYSGRLYGSSVSGSNWLGYYPSSSGYSDSGIRGLSLISGHINPSNILSKNDGYSVRCVFGD